MTDSQFVPLPLDGVPPGGAIRTDLPTHESEARPGGLLAIGTEVEVVYLDGSEDTGRWVGLVVDRAAVPAPYLSLRLRSGGHAVVFLGPGVAVYPALPMHPAE